MDRQTKAAEPPPTPSTTDDESLTTSTASFESWTIVNEKQNTTQSEPLSLPPENYIEVLPTDDAAEVSESIAEEEQEDEPPPDYESATITNASDEFSDEVSIISESDGGEVLTSQPYLREHLHKLNLKFTTGKGLDFASLLQQQQQEEHRLQLEQHRRSLQESTSMPSSSVISTAQARQRKRRSPSIEVSQKLLRSKAQVPEYSMHDKPYNSCLFFKGICQVIYYTISLVLLVFSMYMLSNWLWPHTENTIKDFQAQINDMELQNNLMRAEIDLLTKQVNYLTKLDKEMQDSAWEHKEEKPKPKRQQCAWDERERLKEKTNTPTNNDANEGVLTGDEKQEESNKHPEFKNNAQEIDELDELLALVDDDDEDDKDEDVINSPNETIENSGDKIVEKILYQPKARRNDEFQKPGKRRNNFNENRKRKDNSEERLNKNKKFNSRERFNDNSSDRKDDNNNFRKHNKNSDSSNERFNNDDSKEKRNNYKMHKHQRENSKENYDNGNERKFKENKYKNDNSKERGRNYKPRSNSKEFKKQEERRKFNSKERFDDTQPTDGEWHEKLMQQREKARHEQEENLQDEKNWYLNRHDGREQWRTDEINRR